MGWMFFVELPHPKGMDNMAGVTATVCRAANPGRARTHHPARRLQLAGRWEKGPRTWAVKMGRGCLAESRRDKCHFLHPALGHPPQDPGKL